MRLGSTYSVQYQSNEIIDSVGLGSDFDGIESTPKGLEDVSKYPALVRIILSHNHSPLTQSALRSQNYTAGVGHGPSWQGSPAGISFGFWKVRSVFRESFRRLERSLVMRYMTREMISPVTRSCNSNFLLAFLLHTKDMSITNCNLTTLEYVERSLRRDILLFFSPLNEVSWRVL